MAVGQRGVLQQKASGNGTAWHSKSKERLATLANRDEF